MRANKFGEFSSSNQPMTIESLLPIYWQAKETAEQAAAHLSDVQEEIVKLLPKKAEGTVTQQIGDDKVTIIYSINRTADAEKLKADWNNLPESVQDCFSWKPSVSVTALRLFVQPEYASRYITAKPAKPSLKIEKK